ncbi:MAG: DUF4129 domain-containing protein [Anaerolineales bacterium]|nr:DUF4129 domain-containing protein [Anaerolineales bacterium]
MVICYRTLSRAGRDHPAAFIFTILGSVLLVAYFSTRIMYFMRIKAFVRRGLTVILLGFAWIFALNHLLYADLSLKLGSVVQRALLAFRDRSIFLLPEFGVILIILLIWSRGVVIAQRWMSAQVVVRSFRVGVLIFLGLAFLQGFPWEGAPGVEFHLFLLAGLVGMGAGRAAELGVLRGGQPNVFDRSWLLGVGVGASLVVIIALVVAGFASTYLVDLALRLTILIVEGVVFLLMLVLSPLIFLLIVLVAQLAEGLLADILTRLEEIFRFSALREILSEVLQFLLALFNGLIDILSTFWRRLADFRELKTILLLGVILLAVMFLLVLLGRRWRRQTVGRWGLEDRQFIFDLAEFTSSLRKALRDGAKRLIHNLQRLRQGGRFLAAARIRRIYTQMMRMSSDLDSPRLTAQTPWEFLSTLKVLFPNRGGDLACITEAYQRVRYGELPETREEVARVEAAWRAVREEGEILRQAKRSRRKDKTSSSA